MQHICIYALYKPHNLSNNTFYCSLKRQTNCVLTLGTKSFSCVQRCIFCRLVLFFFRYHCPALSFCGPKVCPLPALYYAGRLQQSGFTCDGTYIIPPGAVSGSKYLSLHPFCFIPTVLHRYRVPDCSSVCVCFFLCSFRLKLLLKAWLLLRCECT